VEPDISPLVIDIKQAIEPAGWLDGGQALGSLTSLCSRKALSVLPLSLLLESTQQVLGFPQMRNVMLRSEYALPCMEQRKSHCKWSEQETVDRNIADVVFRYLFLVERVHIVRAPFIDRMRDPVWVIGAVLTVGGFASIMGYEFVAPRSDLSRVDGICRIGIHPDAGIAVIALDTTINVALIGIFIWQLQPALGSTVPWRYNGSADSSARTWNRPFLNLFRRATDKGDLSTARLSSSRQLKVMLIRNVIGSSLLLCATIANNAIFLTWSFALDSHACQLMCLTDSK
jgi:hypothetical protein